MAAEKNIRVIPINKFFSLVEVEGKFSTVPSELVFFPQNSSKPLFIRENFIEPEVCDHIVRNLFKNREGKKTKFTHRGHSLKERISLIFDLNEQDMEYIQDKFQQVCPEIEAFYNLKITTDEGMHAVGYPIGGNYGRHSDNCKPIKDENSNFIRWDLVLPKRKLSTVLILSEESEEPLEFNQCSGGELEFTYLINNQDLKTLKFKSIKGLFVAFPSNPLYSHKVHKVTDGLRVSVVNWYDAFLINAKIN